MITIIFAAYVLCLLLALLTVGSLSDYIGRIQLCSRSTELFINLLGPE